MPGEWDQHCFPQGPRGSLRLKGGLGSSTCRFLVSPKALLPLTCFPLTTCFFPVCALSNHGCLKFPLGANSSGLYDPWLPAPSGLTRKPLPLSFGPSHWHLCGLSAFSLRGSAKTQIPSPSTFSSLVSTSFTLTSAKVMAQVFFLLLFQTKLRDCHSRTLYLGLFLAIKLGSHHLRARPPTSSLL